MNGQTSEIPKLVILTGKQKGSELLLTAEVMVVGRTEEADLVIRDKSISRRHASFSRIGGGWVVKDLESKNGIRVNNREANEQGLRTGDVVTVGNIKMKFVDPRELAPLPGQPSPGPLPPQGFPPPAPQPFQQPPWSPPPGPPPGPQPGPGPFPGAAQGGQAPYYSPPPDPFGPPPQIVPGPPQYQPPPGQPPSAAPLAPPGQGFDQGPPPAPFSPPAVQPQILPADSPKDGDVPGVYSPQASVRADLYAPPPEFYAPPSPVKDTSPKQSPLTRGKMALYVAVFAVVGALLGWLLYVTFGPKYKPFEASAMLAVRQKELVDMAAYWADLGDAAVRVETPRIASASYDAALGILTVEAKALGNTYVYFQNRDGKRLGKVGVHVLEGEKRRKFFDRAELTDEQLLTRAKDLMTEGEALANAHLAEAIDKYDLANQLLEYVNDETTKAVARLKLSDLVEEREKRFRKLTSRYKDANKLSDLAAAKDLLYEICDLFPDEADERHQQAKIFLHRISKRKN